MRTHPSLLIHQGEDIKLVLAALETTQHDRARALALRETITQQIEQNSSDKAQLYRDAAQRKWARDREIEIDDGAPVGKGDDPGAYVQAWVWVYDSDLTGDEGADIVE